MKKIVDKSMKIREKNNKELRKSWKEFLKKQKGGHREKEVLQD